MCVFIIINKYDLTFYKRINQLYYLNLQFH